MSDVTLNLVPSKELQEKCIGWVELQKDPSSPVDKRKQTVDDDDNESFYTDSEFDSVSECGTKRRRVGLPLKREVYRLRCEWTACEYETNHVESYARHVGEHVAHVCVRSNEDGMEVYVCQWNGCTYDSNNPDEISRHVNYHSFHTKLKCIGTNIRSRIKLPKCRRNTEWKNSFDLPAPLFCRWNECMNDFRNYQFYLYHVNAHLEENPKGRKIEEGGIECRWAHCGKLFPSVHKLKDHLRCHTKEKIVACPDCGATFCSNTKFHIHCKRQMPIDVQGFRCTHCNKYYPTEGILKEHMRLHIFNYKCTLCDMSCSTPTGLAKHVRYRHVSTRTFPCHLCTHAAKTQQDLDSHMTVHTDGPNFSCTIDGCQYKCKNAYTLDRHIERVHAMQIRWYCCHECPVKYRKSYILTKHLIKVHHLQLPSGHKRFQYTQDDNNCYRMQMVRYEAVDEESNVPPANQAKHQENKKFKIKLNNSSAIPRVEIVEDDNASEDEDKETQGNTEERSEGVSVPVMSNILITIDETDAEGNIIRSRVVEAQETMELPPSEQPPIILT